MRTSDFSIVLSVTLLGLILVDGANAQPPRGGPNAPEQKILEEYDKDDNGWLDADERKDAREMLASSDRGRMRRGRGRFGGNRGVEGSPGLQVKVEDAAVYPDAELYDQGVLRTLFFEFDSPDWEQELEAFKPTDVEVPAKLTVDGKTYEDVGVSFRGASSFFMIPTGLKRSLNVSLDLVHDDQNLYGYKSLNLLNCNGDPSMMSSILYSELASKGVPAPKVNYVKVVINGESWGVYVSSQQFNKVFVKEHFDTKGGARWKVNGSPRGDGGLKYLKTEDGLAENVDAYRDRFEIKSADKDESWQSLIRLCQTLNETPADQLEEKLSPILDLDGVLWFLAVDVATVNSDGYWTRASDYSIYMDPQGKFHVLPHDMNEAFHMGGGPGGPPGGGRGPRGFRPPGFGPPPGIDRAQNDADRPGRPDDGDARRRPGPPNGPPGGFRGRGGRGGFGGPPGHGDETLDPLVGIDNPRMPLRSVLLNNDKWQRQYLENVRTIALAMKWENSGPLVEKYRDLIAEEVAKDTRKLMTTEAFEAATSSEEPGAESRSLRAFLEKRSAFLLNHEAIKALDAEREAAR